MARVTWKMVVLIAILATFAILEFQVAEAQSTVCSSCARHANCYYSTYYRNYYCSCRRGYRGDGLTGIGRSGCRKRKLRLWKIIVSIIGSILGALLLLCLCLACLFKCLRGRKNRGPVVQQSYPQQTSYPPQGVPMASYETHNQKVPGPVGAV